MIILKVARIRKLGLIMKITEIGQIFGKIQLAPQMKLIFLTFYEKQHFIQFLLQMQHLSGAL